MPFCSICGVEYIETAQICTDCQQRLKPIHVSAESGRACVYCKTLNLPEANYCWKCGGSLEEIDFDLVPPGASGNIIECKNCRSKIPLGTDFCIECGYLLDEHRSCINHPGVRSDFLCLVCRQPFCKKCGKFIDGKFICNNDENYNFVGNWVILTSDPQLETLEPARLALEERKIYAVIKDRRDRVQRYLSGQYTLLVPIIQVKKAEKILIEENLLYENVCTSCGHEFNGNPNRCPKCGEEFAF